MRYLGQEYTGKGVTIAIIDSGINVNDPRLAGAEIEGWSIQLGATGHALLASDFTDENGHGTEIAAAVRARAPDAKLLAIKIMGKKLRTTAELMAAGIETATRNSATVINLSLGTAKMGKALLLRDCCANAEESGSVVFAAAHPRGEVAYPADLPETVGVQAHPDCPADRYFYFNPKRFRRKEWGTLSGKFLTHGFAMGAGGKWRGSGMATAYLAGEAACLAEALDGHPLSTLIDTLKDRGLVPVPPEYA
ncbi:MAG: S8 family serine peptidase [Proteobacteria bacterium]|nr:S8 family serine peptidase [Pseudomonadota bacterium]